MLDQLLEDSRLYRKGSDYKNLLDFVVRLRNFAPFNALLLQIQKLGLNHAASARDWRETFGRTINDGARPLLIRRHRNGGTSRMISGWSFLFRRRIWRR